ncbi:hypothetical protein [Nonomuraea sp. bgisy101]|uniref:hypothetical protein n=1 Tax=Nonomuraea sp. bgisy101 TaxID=3413784 RepID=UPI003D7482B4
MPNRSMADHPPTLFSPPSAEAGPSLSDATHGRPPANTAKGAQRRAVRPAWCAAGFLTLALLAGCGATAAETEPSPQAAQGIEQRKEAELATCMKGKGFKYVAFVAKGRQLSEQRKAAFGGDYAAMKAERGKYGFGHFSLYVYPKEFDSPMYKPEKPEINPNWAIQSSLSEQQRKAYDDAHESCYTAAIKKLTGKVVKSSMDHYEQVAKARTQAEIRELDGDPTLVEKAARMADCLKGQGYRVSKTNPTAIATRGSDEIRAQVENLGKTDDVDDSKLPEGQFYEPTLTAAQARPYLTKEIKVALDDLECGKDFYAAYLPREQEIDTKVDAEYGIRTWG